jgi:hypothetical protein
MPAGDPNRRLTSFQGLLELPIMAPLLAVTYRTALAAASWGRNRLDIFGLGTDNRKLLAAHVK